MQLERDPSEILPALGINMVDDKICHKEHVTKVNYNMHGVHVSMTIYN